MSNNKKLILVVFLIVALMGAGFYLTYRKIKSLNANQVVINKQIKDSMANVDAKFNSLGNNDVSQLKLDLAAAIVRIAELESRLELLKTPDTSLMDSKILEFEKKIEEFKNKPCNCTPAVKSNLIKKVQSPVPKVKETIITEVNTVEVQCSEYNREKIVACIDARQDVWKEQCLYAVTPEKSSVQTQTLKNGNKNISSVKETTIIEIQPKKRKLLNPEQCKVAKVDVSTSCHIKYCPNVKTISTITQKAN